MFGTSYSAAAEAVQNRKEARVYFHASRAALDPALRANYREMFRASLQLARALEAANKLQLITPASRNKSELISAQVSA